MKLIDVDELLKHTEMMYSISYPNYNDENTAETNYIDYFIEVNDIYNFEKVDAIPIEWVKQRIDSLEDSAEYERIELGEYGTCCHEQWALKKLIEEWSNSKE